MAFYKKRIVHQDTPEDIAERIAYHKAFNQANKEMFERWPEITADNFNEAYEFKLRRISELRRTP